MHLHVQSCTDITDTGLEEGSILDTREALPLEAHEKLPHFNIVGNWKDKVHENCLKGGGSM